MTFFCWLYAIRRKQRCCNCQVPVYLENMQMFSMPQMITRNKYASDGLDNRWFGRSMVQTIDCSDNRWFGQSMVRTIILFSLSDKNSGDSVFLNFHKSKSLRLGFRLGFWLGSRHIWAQRDLTEMPNFGNADKKLTLIMFQWQKYWKIQWVENNWRA